MSNAKRSADHLTPPTDDLSKKYSWDPPNILSQNRFQILENISDEHGESSQQQASHSKASSKQQDTSQQNISSQQKIKIPPIFLQNALNHQQTINDLKALTVHDFTTTYNNKNLKINLTDSNDYRTVTKYYKENNAQFYTFQDPSVKPLSVVIRHVPISLSEDEINSELLPYNLPIIKITRLVNKEKYPIPLCAIDLTPCEKAKEIFKIKEISKAIVTVEMRRKPNNVPQCYNCQRFGHTKNYCSLKPRCVKCGEQHNHTQCTKNKADPPKCANCDGPHPSNYRGCKSHTDLQNKNPRHQDRSYINSQRKDSQPSFRTLSPEISFANAVQGKANKSNNIPSFTSQNETQTSSPLVTVIINLLKQVLIPIINEIKSHLINEILPSLIHVK